MLLHFGPFLNFNKIENFLIILLLLAVLAVDGMQRKQCAKHTNNAARSPLLRNRRYSPTIFAAVCFLTN